MKGGGGKLAGPRECQLGRLLVGTHLAQWSDDPAGTVNAV